MDPQYYCQPHACKISGPEYCKKRQAVEQTPEIAIATWHCQGCPGPVPYMATLAGMEAMLTKIEGRVLGAV